MSSIPDEVLASYELEGADVRRLGGLINRTFVAERGGRRAIVQRLHPVFAPTVHLDIEAITEHLAKRGALTPRLLRTQSGALWIEHDGEVWRALSYVDGVSYDRIDDPPRARAAGEAVGTFHRHLEDMVHDFNFTRAGVHDTAAHLTALHAALQSHAAREVPEATALGGAILSAGAALPLATFGSLPTRICHGDLKISNLLYAPEGPPRVLCLIDLDTLGAQNVAYELGDALRSWCNPHAEDEASPRLDAALFDAALAGYASAAPGLLNAVEVASLASGTHAVCVELASRFCRDAIEDAYFGWDASRYPSRRAHNLARARSQLALATSVARQQSQLEAIAHRRLG